MGFGRLVFGDGFVVGVLKLGGNLLQLFLQSTCGGWNARACGAFFSKCADSARFVDLLVGVRGQRAQIVVRVARVLLVEEGAHENFSLSLGDVSLRKFLLEFIQCLGSDLILEMRLCRK